MNPRTPDRAIPRPAPELEQDAHKGDAGRVLGWCGSRTMPGAAILFARAAARAGAGLVAVAALDSELAGLVPLASPETILVEPGGTGAFEIPSFRPHACVAGPGLGASERTRRLVESLVAGGEVPLVLDADALNVVADEPEILASYPGRVVITPHPGEAERLLGRGVPRDDDGRIGFARELAQRVAGVCVLKGRHTVVASGEKLWMNSSGNPGMATAGAGDVLAGILGAYLAGADSARWDAWEAITRAVWVHGRAGDLAADALGQRAVIASDLVSFLPQAQRAAD